MFLNDGHVREDTTSSRGRDDAQVDSAPKEKAREEMNDSEHPPSEVDGDWIASRQDAVRYYLWKKWNLRGDDLEEVLQEIMTAALQSFVNYEGRNNAEPGTYLIGIAKNVVQSYFRRLNRHERRQVPIELAECLEAVFKDEAEANDLAQLLKEIIAKLPKKYIQVLELIFYQDYREGEAAKVLGIPADRVYSIKSDALKRLRNLCRKDKRLEAFF
jgi:RNA polymerase sigma factor (sigma-70 family)